MRWQSDARRSLYANSTSEKPKDEGEDGGQRGEDGGKGVRKGTGKEQQRKPNLKNMRERCGDT
jgi:hypothetical protein